VLIRWLERLSRNEPPLIFGDGLQTMDFVAVRDVAHAYLLATTAPLTDEALNVGSGTETSLLELCQQTADAMGSPLRPTFAPARAVNPVTRRCASTARAEALLGFRPAIGLKEGLRALVTWFREQPVATADAR
jgi:UDP-glucose 4-epimerase